MSNRPQLLITKSCSDFLYYLKTIHQLSQKTTRFSPFPLLGMDMGTKYVGLSLTVQQQLKEANDLRALTQSLSNFSKHNQALKKTIIKAKPLTTLSMNLEEQPEKMYRDISLDIEDICSKFKVKGIVAGYQSQYSSSDELLTILHNILVSGDFIHSVPVLLQDESRSSFESYIHMVDHKTKGQHNMGVIDAFKRYKQDIDTMNREDKLKLNSLSSAIILDRAIKEISKIHK